MKTVKLRKVGDSYIFTIPKELKEGEKLYIIENEDGFTVTPFDPEFEEWVKAFDKTSREYKNTLEELAKNLNNFSDDFLENRNQPEIQNREEL